MTNIYELKANYTTPSKAMVYLVENELINLDVLDDYDVDTIEWARWIQEYILEQATQHDLTVMDLTQALVNLDVINTITDEYVVFSGLGLSVPKPLDWDTLEDILNYDDPEDTYKYDD